MFNVMYYRNGFQVDNGKDNDYATFEEALDEALSEVERGICDKFDIVKWDDEDEGELYCICEDGIITFDTAKLKDEMFTYIRRIVKMKGG